ncbi:MAG TPA: hypothetical protein VH619_10095, partial [Verrucomicrobiae bacterium]|nr:hypothetical protein [Verrucomicrobiae bacterium]
MKPGIKFALWLFGVAFWLIVALVLSGIFYVLLAYLRVGLHLAETLPVWPLPCLLLLVGYTWAVYYHLPFFRKRSRRQRILISSGLAAPLILMTILMIYFGGPIALNALEDLSIRKTDRRVETVTLPSGEILENHTYLEESWGDERYNALFLKNPATGASERINDPSRCWNYEAGPSEPSLLQRYPHPQEFVRGDEKVLLIGPSVCKRRGRKNGPYWDIFNFDQAQWGAADYVQSFWKPADPAQASRLASRSSFAGEGPEGNLHYQFDSLDLENNVLTVKRARTYLNGPWGHLSSDEFPDYLVYSACDYHGAPAYDFPWDFDLARTRAENGPRWLKPMPFRMALDYSVITFQGTPGVPFEEKHALAVARPGAKEIAT